MGGSSGTRRQAAARGGQDAGSGPQSSGDSRRSTTSTFAGREQQRNNLPAEEYRGEASISYVQRAAGGQKTVCPSQFGNGAGEGHPNKACGLVDCGWVISTRVVHSAGEKLCSACHRSPGDETFVHLGAERIRRASDVVDELRGTG